MHLKQLANIVNGKLVGKSIDFEGFSIDTRSISNNQIYIALIGKNFDGHRFLEEAQLKGAAAVIVNKLDQLDIPQLVVDDTLGFIKEVANHNRTQYEGKMIGITGTNGKTSTKQITYSLLDNNGTCHKTTGNMNNQIGVPFSLLSLENHHHYSVIEMGTSEPGEIEVLTNHVRPDIAAITNVSMGHLEGLTDTDCIASEKGNILDFHTDLGVAFLPSDSDYLDEWKKSTNAKDILTFGFDKYSDFRVSDININVENNLTNFRFSFDGQNEELVINGIGSHNALNATLSSGIAIYCGEGMDKIAQRLTCVELPQRRLSVFKSLYNSILIDDTYNSNPASLINALDSIQESTKKKICVLGVMKELGERSVEIHQEMYDYANEITDQILLVGDIWTSIGVDKTDSVLIFDDHEEIYDYLVSVLDENTILLVKGSRSTRMDLIADKLKL